MSEKREKRLARVTSADIADVYNGMLGLCVCFDYEGGGSQCFGGYMLDAAQVVRMMCAIGVDALSKARGKSCWVVSDHSNIYEVHPLHAKDGRPFIVAEWKEWFDGIGFPAIAWSDLDGSRSLEERAAYLRREAERVAR